MAFEIEIITDSRFLYKYSSDNLEKECENMVNKIKSNLKEKDLYFEVEREVYKVDFKDSIQFRALLFIQLKNRKQSKKDVYYAVNSVCPTYFKEVKNRQIVL